MFGERCVAQFPHFIERQQFGLKVLLQIALRCCCDMALSKIKRQCHQPRNNEHHRGQ